ncbi:uncharacterized protein PG998_004392 [Apiospora kogelbergensis]|uniref:uncharacterized protein n=1 Tax=Apiospora kogelbergensis TaxID=1337665 RepID=UPI00312FAA54
MKFIVNGCHSATGGYDSASSTSSGRSDISTPKHESDKQAKPAPLRSLKRRPKPSWDRITYEDGGSFGRMRLPKHSAPRLVTPAPSERLAAELVWCLDAAPGTGLDLHLAALQHATKLLVASWFNMQRRWTRCKWLDAKLYDAALRSLQQALEHAFKEDSSSSHLTTTTLAAQTILHKLEVTYFRPFVLLPTKTVADSHQIVCNDVSISYQSSHAAGLSAVISTGGYSRGFSELDLHLIFESFFTVHIGRALLVGRPPQSPRHDPLKPTLLSRFYRFWTEVAVWPTLVRRLRHLHANPTDVVLAAEVALQAGALLAYLDGLDQSVFTKAVELGSIVEVENDSRNSHHHSGPKEEEEEEEEEEEQFTPKSCDFANYNLAHFFSAHAFFTVVTLRILHCAQSLLARGFSHVGEGQQHRSQAMEEEEEGPCRRPSAVASLPLHATPTAPGAGPGWQLVLAYEAGDARQKALTRTALGGGADEVSGGGGVSEGSSPPSLASPSSLPTALVPPGVVERPRDDGGASIVAEAMALTGRSYVQPQHGNDDDALIDWEAELQSMDSVDLGSDLMSYDLLSWDLDLQGSVLG